MSLFVFRLNYVYFVFNVFDVVFGCVKLSSASKVSYLVVALFGMFSVVFNLSHLVYGCF